MIEKGYYHNHLLVLLLLFLVALLCYFTGLNSLYLPSNGDEMVYSRIARLTGQSGDWLPLVSDLGSMRNTKPPVLFWQAMLAGDWGQSWQLWRLRLPAVFYSVAVAVGVGAVAWRLAQLTQLMPQRAAAEQSASALSPQVVGLTAACVYLCFFSSFRYGRPYLTSAAETFWLCLPFGFVLWRSVNKSANKPFVWPSALASVAFGLYWGVGLLYKSFALVLPTAAGLWLALLILAARPQAAWWKQVWPATWRVGLMSSVAVALFAMWFAVDPDPAAVWREFVVGENMGKVAPAATSGARSVAIAVAVQALAWVENAGPLAGVMLGLIVWLAQRGFWRASPPSHIALAAWALVWLAVFCLPEQRSARYVIPAMPALAVLLALNWHRIGRGWFVASMALCVPVIVVLAALANGSDALGIASAAESLLAGVIGTAALVIVLAGLMRPAWTRTCAVAVSLFTYALLNATLAPFNGPAGQFNAFELPTAQAPTKIAVPSSFNAQHERYRFTGLPLVNVALLPYASTRDEAKLAELLASHSAVVWQAHGTQSAPACVTEKRCQIVAQRWDIRSRHQSGEIRLDNLLQPAQWAFAREWVLVRQD
jgi:hypothetical protein